MKKRISDYIAQFLVENQIDTIFSVVGGGAMYLNDSLGHNPQLHCVYQHHEQACSMAAEGYARVNNKIAVVCVTSGPGAINALNGVVGAYQDSIPMIVLSGQVKTTLTVRNSGLDLRTLGGQEFDIVSSLKNATKYAEMVTDPKMIRYCLEKALFMARDGRPGPCWLDIPLDIQSRVIDVDTLPGYEVNGEIDIEKNDATITNICNMIQNAKRPVIYAGNGIRISQGEEEFKELVNRLGIPVVTCWNSIDLIESEHPYYVGRGGIMGDRAGNFAVQNSDLVLAIGNRLSIYQVGYDKESWARKAYVIDVDIDPQELNKPTIRVDMPVCMDAKVFLSRLNQKMKGYDLPTYNHWVQRCRCWKEKYPVVMDKHYKDDGLVNVYAFIDTLSRECGSRFITVVSNGSASVVGSQSYYISEGQRFIMNCALSSMGYGLPASIGVCEANDRRDVVCIEGDGSIQMNIQELQTVVTNALPIKIFIINNGGYHQIRQTQKNVFSDALIGVGPESGDLGFPDFEKIAWAYGIPYERIQKNSELVDKIRNSLNMEGYCICEVMCSMNQCFEPKLSTKRMPDGTLYSPPLEDMAPFLSRTELEENMIIGLYE
ncbi:MAG: thiamine pyrophosphate-binding protein [Lachnospiraceae bacterium]|nr:thiamine pyrophosphate-binding protein [Lachnospiraceae bacterium]